MSPAETVKRSNLPSEIMGFPYPVYYDSVLDKGNLGILTKVKTQEFSAPYIFLAHTTDLYGNRKNIFANINKHEYLDIILKQEGMKWEKIVYGQLWVDLNIQKVALVVFNDKFSSDVTKEEGLILSFFDDISPKLLRKYSGIPVSIGFGEVTTAELEYMYMPGRKSLRKVNKPYFEE